MGESMPGRDSVLKKIGTFLAKCWPLAAIGFGVAIPASLLVLLIRWINAPEIYPLLQCQDRFIKGSGANNPNLILLDLECIVETDRIFITVPVRAVSVKKRDDGQRITTAVFSDVDCVGHDWGNVPCAQNCAPDKHIGGEAVILVWEDEDVKIWEAYLSEQSAKESSVSIPFKPGRVLPPSPSEDQKPPEAPAGK